MTTKKTATKKTIKAGIKVSTNSILTKKPIAHKSAYYMQEACEESKPIENIKQFFAVLLSDSSQLSVKRFLTIIVSIHFVIASFVALFSRFSIVNTLLLGKILEYDFYIIIVGFGFITASGFLQVLISKYKAQEANPNPADPQVNIENVENIENKP